MGSTTHRPAPFILLLLAFAAGMGRAQPPGPHPPNPDNRPLLGDRFGQFQTIIGRFRMMREQARTPDHRRRIDEMLADPKIPRVRRRLIDTLVFAGESRRGGRDAFMLKIAYEAARNWLVFVEGREPTGALSEDYHRWVMNLRMPLRRNEADELGRLVGELAGELERAHPPSLPPVPGENQVDPAGGPPGPAPRPPPALNSPAAAAGVALLALLTGILLGGGGRRVAEVVTGWTSPSVPGDCPELRRCRDLMRLYSGSFHRLKNHLGLARRYDGDPEGLGEVLGDSRTRSEIRELGERAADELGALAARVDAASAEAAPARRLIDRALSLVTKVSSDLVPRLSPERLRTLEELEGTGSLLGGLAEEARQFSLELCSWSASYMVDVQELARALIEGLPYKDCCVLGSPDGVDAVVYVPSASKWREGVKEALINLTDNAKQAGARRIRLTWELGAAPRGRGTQVLLGIEDDAGGIPPELAGKVFSPHVSGREDGTGMGLPRVRQIAQNLGGVVDFRPVTGGTRFEMRLPVLPGVG